MRRMRGVRNTPSKGIDKNQPATTVQVPMVTEEGKIVEVDKTIYVRESEANLRLITGQYTDSISVDAPLPDYEALLAGAGVIPIQATVTNMGTQPIKELAFTVGSSSSATAKELNLQPGESLTLTLDYTVVNNNGTITDPAYSVSATFEDNTTKELKDAGQTIYLNVPDLGVSEIETVQQQDGKRVIQFSLFNQSPSKLEGSGRQVQVGLFSDPECTEPIGSQYVDWKQVTAQKSSSGEETFTVSGDGLALIDQGGYLAQATIDLKGYVEANGETNGDNAFLEDGEFRENGINVYLKAWVVEADNQEELQEAGEIYTGNNVESVTFESLLDLAEGELFTTKATITHPEDGGEGTAVQFSIQNNSLQAVNSGSGTTQVVYLNLRDAYGNLLETQETTLRANWGPEDLQKATVEFTKTGSQVDYYFGERSSAASAELTNIQLDGIPLKLENGTQDQNGVTVYKVQADQSLASTLLTLGFKGKNATATVNNKAYGDNANRVCSDNLVLFHFINQKIIVRDCAVLVINNNVTVHTNNTRQQCIVKSAHNGHNNNKRCNPQRYSYQRHPRYH